MLMPELSRRRVIGGAGVIAAASISGLAQRAIAQAADLRPIALPPPIGRAERFARLARAQKLMRANGIGAASTNFG